MSDTGGLIVYKIISLKLRGVLEYPEHPPGYALLRVKLAKNGSVERSKQRYYMMKAKAVSTYV